LVKKSQLKIYEKIIPSNNFIIKEQKGNAML